MVGGLWKEVSLEDGAKTPNTGPKFPWHAELLHHQAPVTPGKKRPEVDVESNWIDCNILGKVSNDLMKTNLCVVVLGKAPSLHKIPRLFLQARPSRPDQFVQ